MCVLREPFSLQPSLFGRNSCLHVELALLFGLMHEPQVLILELVAALLEAFLKDLALVLVFLTENLFYFLSLLVYFSPNMLLTGGTQVETLLLELRSALAELLLERLGDGLVFFLELCLDFYDGFLQVLHLTLLIF